MTRVHFTDTEVRDYRSSARMKTETLSMLHLSLLNHDVFAAPRGDFYMSTPMGEEDVETLLQAFRSALDEIKMSTVITT